MNSSDDVESALSTNRKFNPRPCSYEAVLLSMEDAVVWWRYHQPIVATLVEYLFRYSHQYWWFSRVLCKGYHSCLQFTSGLTVEKWWLCTSRILFWLRQMPPNFQIRCQLTAPACELQQSSEKLMEAFHFENFRIRFFIHLSYTE